MRTVAVFSWLMMFSVALGATFDQQGEIKTCEQNDDCTQGECCVGKECTPFLPKGERCNIFTQILSLQCPCEIGSSCFTTECRSIAHEYFGKEVVEDRDDQHISANTVDE